MNRIRLGLCTIAVLATQPASAALITYTTDFATNGYYFSGSFVDSVPFTDGSSFTYSSTENVALRRFDPTLGTLTGVAISMTSSFFQEVLFGATDSVRDGNFPSYDASAGFLLVDALQVRRTDPASLTQTRFASLTDSCSATSLTNQAHCDDYKFSGYQEWNLSSLATGPLSSYVGTDPLDFALTVVDTYNFDCDSNDRGDVCRMGDANTSWSGSFIVAYAYTPATGPGDGDGGGTDGGNGGTGGNGSTPVDEPGLVSLLSAGFFMLGFVRRRSARYARAI